MGLMLILRKARTLVMGVLRLSEEALPDSRALGRRGEADAARYLRQRGYVILERNYRTRLGEVDLVAFKDGAIAFVEVKARTESSQDEALEAVTRRKRQRLIRAARDYVARQRLDRHELECRFDVVSVLYGPRGSVPLQVEHICGAFEDA